MSENTPLTFLKMASKAIETVGSRPELASIDMIALKKLSAEQNLSLPSLLRHALKSDEATVPNMALATLVQLGTLNERVRNMAAQIERQPELLSHAEFNIPGFNRLVRDTLMSLQFITQVFPDFQAGPEYQAFLTATAQLAQFLEACYGSAHPLVMLLRRGGDSERFFEFQSER